MDSKFKVIQSGRGNFCFCRSPSLEKVHVFLLAHPDDRKGSELLATTENNFSVFLPDLEGRAYFLIRTETAEYVLAERTVAVEGMNNFRDLGGYTAADRRTIRWGRLYRADHLHNAAKEGIALLKTLGIHTVIDYRSANEAAKYPNKQINGKEHTIHLDPNAHTAELAAQFSSDKNHEDMNLINKIIEQKAAGKLLNQYDMVMEQYQNFVEKTECRQAFAQMLKIAAEDDAAAIVQHCRGGKDRTGFGAMLLLGVLGVNREAIIQDYMLTHENRIKRNNAKMAAYRCLTKDQDILNYLYSLIDTKPEFISRSLDLIEKKYSSIVHYTETELGITKSEIEKIRMLYLE